jgi:tetratricopeptide (TPR) repeat protein
VWPRAALTAAACILIGLPEWTRPSLRLGVGIEPGVIPIRACDFMAAHAVRGRGFNPFAAGGYMVYRFWPDRTRLPFMDIHQAGTREDRTLYALAQQDSSVWHRLDEKYDFDYVLVYPRRIGSDHLVDFLDDDPARWALVFNDDAGALFVKREGTLAATADSFAYRHLRAGVVPATFLDRSMADATFRGELEAELQRVIRESPWNGRASMMLAPLWMMDGQTLQARELLDHAIRANPRMFELHAARGEVALAENRPALARADFERERALAGETAYLDDAIARSLARLGDREAARAWYRRALRQDPGDATARDSLDALARESRP